jgi:hypothetical protein
MGTEGRSLVLINRLEAGRSARLFLDLHGRTTRERMDAMSDYA